MSGTLADFNPSAVVQAVVYGGAKVGKTFGAGTFPRPNWIDFDKGIATLVNKDFVAAHGWRPDIKFGQFHEGAKTSAGVVTKATALDEASRYFDSWMKPGKIDEFDTWVIDTGTFLAEAAMDKALMLLSGKHGFKGITSNTLEMGIQYGLVVPKLQDYGSERSMVEQFVSMVKSSGKHMLFICHEKTISDDDGKIVKIVPLLTGQSVDKINAMFDDVWRIEQVKRVVDGKPKMVRVCRTASEKPVPGGGFLAGTRLGLPDGTLWEWDAISSALETNIRAIESLTNKTKEK